MHYVSIACISEIWREEMGKIQNQTSMKDSNEEEGHLLYLKMGISFSAN